MFQHQLRVLCLACCAICAGCAAAYNDVGPNLEDGKHNSGPSSAGLIYQLAGDGNTLYAVSLDAGVWRRQKGATWQQMTLSSPLTASLAVDPGNPSHLVSGDRNNGASYGSANSSLFDLSLGGIWESFDSGDHWQLTGIPLIWLAKPAAKNANCQSVQSQAVSAVIITPASTILAATSCGIARKKTTESQFDFTATPADVEEVTAITFARIDSRTSNLWALATLHSTQGFALLFSNDEGVNWGTPIPIQSSVDGMSLPQSTSDPALSRGDFRSLLAFGDTVVMTFNPQRKDNQTALLYFNRDSQTFSTQLLGNDAKNGTGNGGRRGFHALFVAPPFAPGNGMHALVNAAQDIMAATALDKNGQLKWDHLFKAACGTGCPGAAPIHGDLWDMLPDDDNSNTIWVAGDGGVFRFNGSPTTYNDGLFTQHIHAVAIVDPGLLGSVTGPRLNYVTSDNDGWIRYGAPGFMPHSGWHTYNELGDVNWVESDRGNSALSLQVRDTLNAELPDYGAAPDGASNVGSKVVPITCIQVFDDNGNPVCGTTPDSSATWKTIQTGPGLGSPHSGAFLDTVWLATLPLQYKSGDKVVELPSSSPLAQQLQKASGNVVVLRNWGIANQPDINSSKFKGWFLENGQVPSGASRIWASVPNGQQPFFPVYYVCTCNASPVQLFKSSGENQPWTPVTVQVTLNSALTTLNVLPVSPNATGNPAEFPGPVWVDPINPNRLVVLTTQGVALSPDGGTTWTLDAALTALVTGSGRYPMTNYFPSANDNGVVMASRGLAFMYVSDVAFGWNDDQIAVASPFTGVFYRPASNQLWKNATGALPTPLPSVASIAFWNTELYVGTEGRSLLETFHLPSAPIATWFDITRGNRLAPVWAQTAVALRESDGAGVANAQVNVAIIGADGSMNTTTLTADASGQLAITSMLKSGDRVFLSYAGTLTIAAADTAFHN
jgi:hypothetical protein